MLNLPLKILETQTLTAPAASVTFTIGTKVTDWDALAKVTSRHLIIIVNAASPDAVAQRDVHLQFNADAGANYNYQYLEGANAVDSAARLDAQNEIALFPIPGTTYANAFGGGQVVIPHAFGAVNHKALVALGGAVEDEIELVVGRWANVAAITSIVLAPSAGNFATGSEFHLAVVDERYLIEEILLAADGLPVFRNITLREGDLDVVAYARTDVAAVEDEVIHEINDDAVAANYPAQELIGRAGATSAASPVNQEIGMVSGDNATANVFGALVAAYSQYEKASNQPHFLSTSGYHETTGPTAEVRVMSGRRSNIEPITKLEYAPNGGTLFKSGSLFSLYHVPKRLIGRVELQADTATVTFSSIPQGFEALVLNVYVRTDIAAALAQIEININDDAAAANYKRQLLQGVFAAVDASRSTTLLGWLYASGGTAGALEYSGGVLCLPNYTKADSHKHFIGLSGCVEDRVTLASCRWISIAAITKIALIAQASNFKHGSVFELWGILPTEGLPAITVGG